MKLTPKPVHRCYTCLLNLGKTCWEYACPRRQWERPPCRGFANAELYRQFREWQEAPHVKTRKQLRRETFRTRVRKMPARRFRKPGTRSSQ